MAKQPPLNDQDRENLSAYLDGELDDRAARALEVKLNADPRARAEADALSRTWHLLEYLPQPPPSAAFTSRTLERVSVLRPVQAGPAARRRRPWALGVGWAAAVVAAAVVGFAGVTYLVPAPQPPARAEAAEPADLDQQLARDLRVIENFHRYVNADDLGFLRSLDDPELFGDENP